jgi:hypothetical protein
MQVIFGNGSIEDAHFMGDKKIAQRQSAQPFSTQQDPLLQRGFYSPRVKNIHIMDAQNYTLESDLYHFACGNWQHVSVNRVFESTVSEVQKHLDVIDAMTRDLLPVPYSSTNESEISARPEELFFYNPKMQAYYRACMQYCMFARSTKTNGDSQLYYEKSAITLHPSIEQIISYLRAFDSRHANSTAPSRDVPGSNATIDITRILIAIYESGAVGPFHPVIREVPYFISSKIGVQRFAAAHISQGTLSLGAPSMMANNREHREALIERIWNQARAIFEHVSIESIRVGFQVDTYLSDHAQDTSASIDNWTERIVRIEDAQKYISLFCNMDLRLFLNETSNKIELLDGRRVYQSRAHSDHTVSNEWVMVQSVSFLSEFAIRASAISASQWIDYCKYIYYKWVIDMLPPVSAESSERDMSSMCIQSTNKMFPVSHCKTFATLNRNYHKNVKLIQEMYSMLVREYKQLIARSINERDDNNLWCGRSERESLVSLQSHLDRLQVSIADCERADDMDMMSRVMNSSMLQSVELLLPVSDRDMVRNVIEMTRSSGFRVHRRAFVDPTRLELGMVVASSTVYLPDAVGSSNFDKYKVVNAWYNALYHSIYVPLALTKAPFFSHMYDTQSMYAWLGFVLMHEYTHSTESLVYQDSVISNPDSCPMRRLFETFSLYKSPIRSRNQQENWYAVQTFYENRADWIGLYVAMSACKRVLGAQFDKERFLIEFSQLWCSGQKSHMISAMQLNKFYRDPHALAFDRVNNAPRMARIFD